MFRLDGLYLARYSHSPAGAFDEAVALAGLAWNFPSSCAWAARVYVSSRPARDHGVSSVGLPSRLAAFRAAPRPPLGAPPRAAGAASWWDQHQKPATGAAPAPGTGSVALLNVEPRRRGRGLRSPVCEVEVPQLAPAWSPRIHLSLPSFSGGTPDVPGLLKYSLRLVANVRVVPALAVRPPAARPAGDRGSGEVMDAVLCGRPLVCLAFDRMEMRVQAPEAWAPRRGGPPLAAA